ncbi:MAG TPA: SCP2 sterol-binding domain-containing protein [Acidimicrobiia bacterium]|nr:SCP2 sterol-binding domain-containing protein [Acidimicrobiia bacterium]
MVTTVGELNGVARLLARVVDEKLEEPEKKPIVDRLDFVLAVHVVDVGQSASVAFRSGDITVHKGCPERPDLAVECDNATFVQFTMFRLNRRGIPIVTDGNARSVVRKLLTRRLVIRGMVRHLPSLYGFLRFVATGPETDL